MSLLLRDWHLTTIGTTGPASTTGPAAAAAEFTAVFSAESCLWVCCLLVVNGNVAGILWVATASAAACSDDDDDDDDVGCEVLTRDKLSSSTQSVCDNRPWPMPHCSCWFSRLLRIILAICSSSSPLSSSSEDDEEWLAGVLLTSCAEPRNVFSLSLSSASSHDSVA